MGFSFGPHDSYFRALKTDIGNAGATAKADEHFQCVGFVVSLLSIHSCKWQWCCSGSAPSVGARRQSHNSQKKRKKYVKKNGTDDDGDGGDVAAAASKPLSRTMNNGPTMVVCKKKIAIFVNMIGKCTALF